MKKVICLMLVALIVLSSLASCGNIDNSEIVGVWYNEVDLGKISSIESSESLSIFEFFENGEVRQVATMYGIKLFDELGEYTIKGDKITLTFADRDSFVLTYCGSGDSAYLQNDAGNIYVRN